MFLHVVHLCVWVNRVRSADCNFVWETYSSDSDGPSIGWVRVLDTSIIAIFVGLTLIIDQADYGSIVLVCASFLQTWLISTRYKICYTSSSRSPCASNACLLVWRPSEFELALFCFHSPAHSLLWMAVTYENFYRSMIVMAIIYAQVGRIPSDSTVESAQNVIVFSCGLRPSSTSCLSPTEHFWLLSSER